MHDGGASVEGLRLRRYRHHWMIDGTRTFVTRSSDGWGCRSFSTDEQRMLESAGVSAVRPRFEHRAEVVAVAAGILEVEPKLRLQALKYFVEGPRGESSVIYSTSFPPDDGRRWTVASLDVSYDGGLALLEGLYFRTRRELCAAIADVWREMEETGEESHGLRISRLYPRRRIDGTQAFIRRSGTGWVCRSYDPDERRALEAAGLSDTEPSSRRMVERAAETLGVEPRLQTYRESLLVRAPDGTTSIMRRRLISQSRGEWEFVRGSVADGGHLPRMPSLLFRSREEACRAIAQTWGVAATSVPLEPDSLRLDA